MQLTMLPWMALSGLLRATFDTFSERLVFIHAGSVQVLDNIAVLLVYQPKGVDRSTFLTIKHLIENGFSPVVVINHRVEPRQLKELQEISLVVIERPNYGYDFGGYRQGILYVLNSGYKPKNLLVLNDSIWFPITNKCSFLESLKGNQTDIYGLVMNDLSQNRSRHHIQSYLFNFKKTVIDSESFQVYWNKLFLSNNKLAVIRLCEVKMTDHFRRLGFSVDAKFRVADLYKAMAGLSHAQLKKIVEYQKIVDPRRAKLIDAAQRRGQSPQHLIDERLLGKYFLIAHPILLLGELDCPVLKKDRQFTYRVQRSAVFEENLHNNISDVVLYEMRQRDGKLDLCLDHRQKGRQGNRSSSSIGSAE